MKQRDYQKLSTATLVKIQGRSAHGSAEERVIRDELRRRREDWFALGPASRKASQDQLILRSPEGKAV